MIKMIIVFVLTSRWPHTKSPPEGASPRLAFATAVTGEAARPGLTAAGWGSLGAVLGDPEHSFPGLWLS